MLPCGCLGYLFRAASWSEYEGIVAGCRYFRPSGNRALLNATKPHILVKLIKDVFSPRIPAQDCLWQMTMLRCTA
jgi:hypothetical protein